MKLSSISANINYHGNLTCFVSFTGNGSTISHTCNDAQIAELQAMLDRWKADLLRESAGRLFQALDDMKAIEHKVTE
jgi:hypothetical protein